MRFVLSFIKVLKMSRLFRQDQDQDQYFFFKTKTKTIFHVLEAPRDQDQGLETTSLADAERDGRPAEYRWRSVRKFRVIPFLVARRNFRLTPAAPVPCSKAANIEERKTWTQREVRTWKNSVRGQEPPKMYIYYIVYQPRRRPNSLQSFDDLR